MTTAQRAMERLAKSITVAFPTVKVEEMAYLITVPVKCETVELKGSTGFATSGLRLTIGNRVLTTNEHGEITKLEQDGKEIDVRQLLREPARAEQNKRATETAKNVGDFSKVDWGGRG